MGLGLGKAMGQARVLSASHLGIRASDFPLRLLDEPIPEIIFRGRDLFAERWAMKISNDESIPAAPVQRILAAATFAAEKHAAQKRKGAAAEPYVNHLIEVAQLIASSSEQLDANLVMAGFLHDTIEDTSTTAEELEQVFGSDISALVVELTDDKSLPKEVRKELQVREAPHKSVRAQVIKLADKISNLRSLLTSPPANWNKQRKREYFEWGRRVVDALSAPNPILKAEFDRTYAKFKE
jgi:(p)ppGpp synthase/HD superfamily hydrolase